ncbi:MAG: VWA domain-containing protein [Chloroflexota bacterium]
MRFTSPLFLLLLLLVPVIAWMGWPAAGAARRREFATLALRLVIVLCIILSLAGIEIVRSGSNLAVVFLIDVSDSMPDAAIAAETDYVLTAINSMSPDDQAAVVLFGADALVERAMIAGNELGQITSAPITTQTDLAEAIRLGLALFPSDAGKRMVILSDGAQTTGDALKAAELAAAGDVQILSVPFIMQPGAEALVTATDAPSRLLPGEEFDLTISIHATEAMRSTVRVFAGDEVVYERQHDLREGLQTFTLPLTASEPGFIRYQVQIVPEQDGFYQNNRLDAFSEVQGPPRILVVAPAAGEALPGGQIRSDEHSAIVHALQAAGFNTNILSPGSLPSDLPTLAQYNSVVLVDVPATALGQNQMEALQTYVRDLGGGLVAVGGPTSFGVGGYYGTPLEEALPVDMQLKDEKRRPSLAIVFIIDHSGSMSETSGGVEKLELAKEAAARSVELLFPTDRVGVIAFDDVASWVVPMTDLSNPSAVMNAIGTIRSGGGTDILAGVQAMADVLPGDPATVKHVILLTDGGADPTSIPELVEQMYTEYGITLSTVAVGHDAAPFLADLAALGNGRHHFTTDASSIPSIFTEETTLATRAYIVEETFHPTLVNSSPILSGIESVPPLYGYVATSPKDLAQVILQSGKEDPILATWQYGLGRAVAFTSDGTGRWGQDWVPWDGFASFWAQAVRYTLGDVQNAALEVNVETTNNGASLTVDALSRSGEFINGYVTEANIIAPNGEAQAVQLQQVAPGRYEANFNPTEEGVYLIRLSGQPADGTGFSETTGWTMSYSPEYRQFDSDPDLLLRLAAVTGGEVASADPAEVFAHSLRATRATRPIWPWLVALAILLWPFDIAARRLILTRHDWIRLRDKIVEALTSRRAKPAAAPESAPRMEALFQAKGRARENLQAPPQEQAPPQPEPTSVPNEPVEPKPKEKGPAGSTTSALLERKKSLRKKQ